MGEIAVYAEIVRAAQAEQVPCESRLGGEPSISQSVSCPGHRWVGGTQGTAIPSSRAWQLLHDSVLFQRGSLEVIPGPELFRLVAFASSPCAEGDVLGKADHSYTLPFFLFYRFSLCQIKNKSRTKVRTPISPQSDELGRNLSSIHTCMGHINVWRRTQTQEVSLQELEASRTR